MLYDCYNRDITVLQQSYTIAIPLLKQRYRIAETWIYRDMAFFTFTIAYGNGHDRRHGTDSGLDNCDAACWPGHHFFIEILLNAYYGLAIAALYDGRHYHHGRTTCRLNSKA